MISEEGKAFYFFFTWGKHAIFRRSICQVVEGVKRGNNYEGSAGGSKEIYLYNIICLRLLKKKK